MVRRRLPGLLVVVVLVILGIGGLLAQIGSTASVGECESVDAPNMGGSSGMTPCDLTLQTTVTAKGPVDGFGARTVTVNAGCPSRGVQMDHSVGTILQDSGGDLYPRLRSGQAVSLECWRGSFVALRDDQGHVMFTQHHIDRVMAEQLPAALVAGVRAGAILCLLIAAVLTIRSGRRWRAR